MYILDDFACLFVIDIFFRSTIVVKKTNTTMPVLAHRHPSNDDTRQCHDRPPKKHSRKKDDCKKDEEHMKEKKKKNRVRACAADKVRLAKLIVTNSQSLSDTK